MRIALCDDERAETENLKNLIYKWSADKKVDAVCFEFTSGKDLLEEEKFDLYFLDFLMPEMNGAELALKLLEKFGGAVSVCYLTSYEAAAAKIINSRINAVGFLTKPVDEKELFAKLDSLYEKSFFDRIVIRSGSDNFVVYPQEVLYAEAVGRKVEICFADKKVMFSCPFADIEKDFLSSKLFFKIHRSYIINLSYVTGYNKKDVSLKNGDTLPLSRKIDIASALNEYNFMSFR